jgi:hypothetical protein
MRASPSAPVLNASAPQLRLQSAVDPEWLSFVGVLLVPALAGLVCGESQRASFFFGAAVYLGLLKWLGWLVLTRNSSRPRAYLAFAAEVFAGLAVGLAWCYFRNLLRVLWPDSYSLREFSVLSALVVLLHVGAGLTDLGTRGLRAVWSRELLARLAVYGPFAAVLGVSLWHISATWGVQGNDAFFHAFNAQVHAAHGLGCLHPLKQDLLVNYPSGFALLNTLCVWVSPLNVPQAVNLQHVLLLAAALFLITTTLATLAGRAFLLLHSLPLLFLVGFPLYALYPDASYQGQPRQAAVAIATAAALLPLHAPVTSIGRFLCAGAPSAVLAVFCLLLNPASAPFALAAGLLGLAIQVGRGSAHLPLRRRTVMGAQGLFGVLALALLVGIDPYYQGLRQELRKHATEPSEPPAPSGFSLARGARGVLATDFISLSPSVSMNIAEQEAYLIAWPETFPYSLYVGGTGLLCLAALLVHWRTPEKGAEQRRAARVLGTCLVLWVGLKAGVNFFAAALSSATTYLNLLRVYLGFLLLRHELLLLFTLASASAILIALSAERRGRWAWAWKAAGASLVVLGCVGPGLGNLGLAIPSGRILLLPNPDDGITQDDLELVAWIDEHLPAGQGKIGLAAYSFRAGMRQEEQYLNAIGGGQALVLYGRTANYRFGILALERHEGRAEYDRHVKDRFDPAWCLRNGIRFFYISAAGFEQNPGLAQARKDGLLRPRKEIGSSGLYEVLLPGAR